MKKIRTNLITCWFCGEIYDSNTEDVCPYCFRSLEDGIKCDFIDIETHDYFDFDIEPEEDYD